MFVLLLLFVLPSFQAIDPLDQFLSTFVANTLGGDGLTSNVGATLAVIGPGTDKAPIVATILANLYGLNKNTKKFVRLASDDVAAVEAALENGASVVAVNWEINGESVKTYAIVNSGGVLESVTKTYTKEEKTKGDSKVHPEQFIPTYASKYHASFLDGFDTPAAAFDAEVKCTATPSCSLTASCVDTRPFCKCLHRSRVECSAGAKCFGEVAFVGYCGEATTLGFDEKKFQYVVDPSIDFIYYNAYVKLEKPCACRPPK